MLLTSDEHLNAKHVYFCCLYITESHIEGNNTQNTVHIYQ